MYYFSLTSRRLMPSICCGSIYGGFLSFIYWNILFSPFINSILCSKSSETVWLQNKVAVSPYVIYCGAINWTFMCSASVVSGNRGISVSTYYRIILIIDMRNATWTKYCYKIALARVIERDRVFPDSYFYR